MWKVELLGVVGDWWLLNFSMCHTHRFFRDNKNVQITNDGGSLDI